MIREWESKEAIIVQILLKVLVRVLSKSKVIINYSSKTLIIKVITNSRWQNHIIANIHQIKIIKYHPATINTRNQYTSAYKVRIIGDPIKI